ncbi:MAG: hypothetical protein ACODAB_02445 [Gemmatimonadota bacterium]
MAGPGGAAQRTEKKSRGLGWLLAGIVVGVVGAVFLPDLASPYLPDGLRGERVQVAGIVEAKSTEGERLLLTVGSEAGATLVTFRDDIARIDLLVSVGDSVRLEVDEYTPFIDDAEIRRVMKPRDWRVVPPAAVDTTAEPDPATTPDTVDADSIETDPSEPDTIEADTTATDPPAEAP